MIHLILSCNIGDNLDIKKTVRLLTALSDRMIPIDEVIMKLYAVII